MKPRSISVKGVIQTLNAFQPLIAFQGERDAPFRMYLHEQVLDAIATTRLLIGPAVLNLAEKNEDPNLTTD